MFPAFSPGDLPHLRPFHHRHGCLSFAFRYVVRTIFICHQYTQFGLYCKRRKQNCLRLLNRRQMLLGRASDHSPAHRRTSGRRWVVHKKSTQIVGKLRILEGDPFTSVVMPYPDNSKFFGKVRKGLPAPMTAYPSSFIPSTLSTQCGYTA